ncbi:hypothetical protein Pyn_23400 [Prunus yedoensis var. nudiflora]|uniref:Uncharacterized protein n=1 Tax=Prunus yedoensis var. nudiflora TaxID=2094558 RepID=A0A314XYN3_PRUYE|nr:hypothetical protein Pyn_23400 [Prunus yedoensis var. nudiflora]
MELGLTASPKVPSVPIIKSHSGPIGEDKEQAKKLENWSSNEVVAPHNGHENRGVLKPSHEGTNGGHGNNGKPTTDLKTSSKVGGGHSIGKPDGGATQPITVAGDEGGNSVGAGAMEGARCDEILEKILEKASELANKCDLSTELETAALPKVPLVPVIKSCSGPEGEDTKQAKKLENGSSNGSSHLLMVVR